MIKKILVFLIGLFLIASLTMAQGATDNPRIISETETNVSEPVAYINYIEGKALFKDFQEVELNIILQQDDEINTIDGRIEILLENGGIIRLDRKTRVIFSTLNENSIMLTIWNGNAYVKKGDFKIGVKSPNRSLNLSQSEWYLMEPEEDFKKWNNTRNEELNFHDEYLPEELSRYGYILNHYGNWRHYDPYGYVWIPQVSFDWQPYLHGHWAWYPIIGWTWVSSEPFGWCAYHYGRWQWDSLFGWYWIPTRHWGPSWVYWYSWGNYWGWCPRWHDDSYYHRHLHHYEYGNSHIWTTVHKDQLKSRDLSKSIVSKSELAKAPRISQNQLRTSPASTSSASLQLQSSSTKTISRSSRNTSSQSPAPARKIYSPDSKISIQRKNPESINSRRTNTLSPSFQKRTDYSARNTIFSPKSYSPRANTQFRPSSKNSIRSFISPSRSFSRPSISRSPSRTIQKKIRKK